MVRPDFDFRVNEKGITLVVVLVVLLVLSLLGTAAMQSSGLQETMSINQRNQAVSFEAAEAALRAGEAFLVSQTQAPTPKVSGSGNCTQVPCQVVWDLDAVELNSGDFLGFDWAASPNVVVTDLQSMQKSDSKQKISADPRYVIEYDGPTPNYAASNVIDPTAPSLPPRQMYRVTSAGAGVTTGSIVILQSNYARDFQ